MPGINKVVRTEWAESNALLTKYYDEEWGMPVYEEQAVFERLCLETFQSGLSWLTILKRREGFRSAFKSFEVDLVKDFGEEDVSNLLNDKNIIRNERKIRAVINNAQATAALRAEGGLSKLIWSFMPETSPAEEQHSALPVKSPESEALTKELHSRGFKFVGPVMLYAAMAAMGVVDLHIVGSHRRGCSGLWNKDGSRKA